MFVTEARLLQQIKLDPAVAKCQLFQAQKELDNFVSAIGAGMLTPTTMTALQDAERKVAQAQNELRKKDFDPVPMLSCTRESYRGLVAKLEAIEDVSSAREARRNLTGSVLLILENGKLTAEMKSAGLAGTLQITLVAGAGFEPTTFGL